MESLRIKFRYPPSHMEKVIEGIRVIFLPEVTGLRKAILYLQAPPQTQFPKGTRRMLATLLSEGTTDFSAEQYHYDLKKYGATIEVTPNAFGFFIRVESLAETWDSVLQLVDSIYQRALLPFSAYERWKKQWEASLDQAQKQSRWHAQRLLSRALWKDHPYEAVITSQDIQNLSYEAIEAYYKNFFQGALRAWVQVGEGEPVLLPVREIKTEKLSLPTWEGGFYTHELESHQVSLRVAIPFFDSDHPQYAAARLGMVLWGGYFGSRLMSRLREKEGWTYGIHARIHRVPQRNYVVVSSEVAVGAWEKALKAIREEFIRLIQEPIPTEEFETARNYLISLWQWESPWDLAETYANYLSWGILDKYVIWAEAFESLTPTQVQQALQKIPISNWIEVAAGALARSSILLPS